MVAPRGQRRGINRWCWWWTSQSVANMSSSPEICLPALLLFSPPTHTHTLFVPSVARAIAHTVCCCCCCPSSNLQQLNNTPLLYSAVSAAILLLHCLYHLKRLLLPLVLGSSLNTHHTPRCLSYSLFHPTTTRQPGLPIPSTPELSSSTTPELLLYPTAFLGTTAPRRGFSPCPPPA